MVRVVQRDSSSNMLTPLSLSLSLPLHPEGLKTIHLWQSAGHDPIGGRPSGSRRCRMKDPKLLNLFHSQVSCTSPGWLMMNLLLDLAPCQGAIKTAGTNKNLLSRNELHQYVFPMPPRKKPCQLSQSHCVAFGVLRFLIRESRKVQQAVREVEGVHASSQSICSRIRVVGFEVRMTPLI